MLPGVHALVKTSLPPGKVGLLVGGGSGHEPLFHALFGLLAGSSLIFLGLYAPLYGINTGLLFNLTTDELLEIAIKACCLSVGSFFIGYFWHHAKETSGA